MTYKSAPKTFKAFSLIELVVVIGLTALVAMIFVPGSITDYKSTSLNSKVSELMSQMYLYQQNAYSGMQNKKHGLKFDTNSYSIFTGNSYAAADSKETITLEHGTTISGVTLSGGGNELIFSVGTLKPNKTGTINMTDGAKTYQIKINKEGFVDYVEI